MARLGNVLKGIGVVLFAAYFIGTTLALPYYNWQYARDHGFVKWLLLGNIVPTAKALAWPYFMFFTSQESGGGAPHGGGSSPPSSVESQPRIVEYVDNEYSFAFQFPSDWKLEKSPSPGEAAGVRLMVRHPAKPMWVVVTVGDIGESMTREQFESSPNREAAVAGMIESTVELYKKTSRDVGATQMIISEKRTLPSNVGVKFYISTAHRTSAGMMTVAGVHILPFGKTHMIAFMMVAPLERAATKDNETIANVFNSFHVLGEKPSK